MIRYTDDTFILTNDRFSYVMRTDMNGVLGHIHFGAPVTGKDTKTMGFEPELGWGTSNMLDGICYHFMPLEWSTPGTGDYRACAMDTDAGTSFFRYSSHRILKGQIPFSAALPGPHGECDTLEVTLKDRNGLELILIYSLYDSALTRRSVLKNRSGKEIRISKFMSMLLDLPGSFEMMTFSGAWAREMHTCFNKVGTASIVNESTTGFSSAHHNPGFILKREDTSEDFGEAYAFNIIYSGNHYSRAQKSTEGLTRVIMGISPEGFTWKLSDGEVFESPETVLTWSSDGLNGVSALMHSFVNDHIVPTYWNGRERPVLFNSWEGCGFDYDENKLLQLAEGAKSLGCELFVLDDGWFGARNSDRAGLGDYGPNRNKLPDGISGLSEKIRGLGLDFGLWVEPEAVNPDSDLYRAHPEWSIGYGDPETVLGRNELLLDLRMKDVRGYIVENVSKVIDDGKLSYMKWDMNRHSTLKGADAHRYILGLYEVMRRIFTGREGLLLENCASGGNRFDLGMLTFSPQIWASDDTDPIERIDIQKGYSYLYPQSTVGAHVSMSPNQQTARKTPLSTRGNISFFGVLGYELDLTELSADEKEEIRRQIDFYKRYRKVFQFGRELRTDSETAVGFEALLGDTAVVGLFHKLLPAAPCYETFKVLGLRNDSVYMVTDTDTELPEEMSKRIISGNALLNGIAMRPLFTGMGRTPLTRRGGDFSSDLFVIEKTV